MEENTMSVASSSTHVLGERKRRIAEIMAVEEQRLRELKRRLEALEEEDSRKQNTATHPTERLVRQVFENKYILASLRKAVEESSQQEEDNKVNNEATIKTLYMELQRTHQAMHEAEPSRLADVFPVVALSETTTAVPKQGSD